MKENIIIGLAGHIDHGKTSLIKALNGFDGDESKEEKQRGITIDISFSNLVLSQKNISFIDVPGHEKLVKNMIAGAFCIDVLLLVIACDDGIMPQSIEHLQIANLLGIKKAICIITKIDLSPKKEHITHLEKQIHSMFKDLQINLLDITTFSIYDKPSHEKLKNTLNTLKIKTRNSQELFFRCYIDRSFTLPGIGSIVTGSIIEGEIKQNEEIYIYDKALQATIKSIQIHNQDTLYASSSQRVALNLKGIEAKSLKRGYLMSKKGYLRGFNEIDVILFPLDPNINLHNLGVQFFIGSKKCNAKIFVLQSQNNKNYIFATLKTDELIFSVFKERFILRNSDKTIAGGEILNPITDRIKKHQKLIYLDYLFKNDFKNAFKICLEVHKKGFGLISSSQRFKLSHQEALNFAKSIPEAFVDEKNLVAFHADTLEIIKKNILNILTKNPLALLSASSLSLKIKWASIEFLQIALTELEENNLLFKKEGLYLASKNPIKNLNDYIKESVYKALCEGEFSPLSPYNIYENLEIDRKSGDNALKLLTKSQKVIRLEHNLFITSENLNKIIKLMRKILIENNYIDLNLFKQKLPLSRKYLIAYLDYLDSYDDIKNIEGKRTLKYKGHTCD